MRHRSTAVAVALIGLLLQGAGCADEFDDFNQVRGFRLLGIEADRPSLFEGDTATMSALVTDDRATFQWEYCPLTVGQVGAFECAVTESDLQAAADAQLGEGVVTIPPFDLGNEPTATFSYDFPAAVLTGICAFILGGGEVPDLDSLPSCDTQYELNIRVTASVDGLDIVGVRDLILRFDDEEPLNQNPTIDDVQFRVRDSGDEFQVMPADGAVELTRGAEYEIVLGIPDSNAESYLEVPDGGDAPEPRLEDLTVSWFFEVGELDKSRSSFIDGSTTFENLRQNFYIAPTVEESSETNIKFWFVIRDNRGGLTFVVRDAMLGS